MRDLSTRLHIARSVLFGDRNLATGSGFMLFRKYVFPIVNQKKSTELWFGSDDCNHGTSRITDVIVILMIILTRGNMWIGLMIWDLPLWFIFDRKNTFQSGRWPFPIRIWLYDWRFVDYLVCQNAVFFRSRCLLVSKMLFIVHTADCILCLKYLQGDPLWFIHWELNFNIMSDHRFLIKWIWVWDLSCPLVQNSLVSIRKDFVI